MPPRKRKAAASSKKDKEQPCQSEDAVISGVDDKVAELVRERLQAVDIAVEEQCQAILDAAKEAVQSYMQEVQLQLVGLPKKVRDMPYKTYQDSLTCDQNITNPNAAAVQKVEGLLKEAQAQSVAAATVAPSTRSLRSRSRTAVPAAAEPATTRPTRTTRGRQPVPKFTEPSALPPCSDEEPAAAAAAAVAATAAGGTTSTGFSSDHQQASAAAGSRGLVESPKPTKPAVTALGQGASTSTAAAALAGDGGTTVPSLPAVTASAGPSAGGPLKPVDENLMLSAAARAQARIDAKLAAIGSTITTGAKTNLRKAQPGEAFFSRNGSPLSICPNVTRTRGRRGGGFPLVTPAGPDAPEASGSMLGSFTILQKGPPPATGAAAATGRGRGRRAVGATATAKEEGGAEGAAGEAAIMITTKDGNSFMVDGAAQSLEGVPQAYRDEVKQQLQLIQKLASKALGAAH